MTTALATTQGELVRAPVAELMFTADQEQMIRDSFANGATKQEFEMLITVAKTRRLNPILRQIHFVKRWDTQKQREVWSTQVSIDGLRAVAQRTGLYDGQDEPEFEYNGKELRSAKVRVYRKDWNRPAVGVALFDEYAQRKKDGSLTQFWREKPHIMLAKCAEALAMRKAFPEDLSGLYTPEEMPEVERRPYISPHADPDEDMNDPAPAESPFDDFMAQLTMLESRVDACADYFDALAIRDELGSKAKPTSKLLLGLQKAREERTISPDQRKQTGALWQRIDRKLSKLESQLKPGSAEDAFTDPDPENDGR